MHYRPDIDGLRAVAVLSVIFYHAGIVFFSGGFIGVDVFFVLSGYLITALMLKDMSVGRFSLLHFYERRARRILPALIVVALACIPFAWVLMVPAQFIDFSQSLIAVATFSSNILFLRESGYFEGAAELKPLLHTWSLAVEEQFYLLFPLLLMALWRFGRSRVVQVLIAILLLSLAWSEWGWRHLPDANFYLLPSRAWELLAGSLCAFVLQGGPARARNLPAAAGLGMILLAVFLYDTSTPVPSLYMLLPVGGTCLVILFAGPGTWVAALLSTRIMVAIGLISYSAYLWHQPLFVFARLQLWIPPTPVAMLGLSAVSLALGWLSWRYVEQPFRGNRPLLPTRPQVFTTSALASAVILGAGFVGYLANGFPTRLPAGYEIRQERLAELRAVRHADIRSGVCNFNRKGPHQTLEDFLGHWDCAPEEQGARAPRLIVVGDSHAADISSALTLNGIDHIQITSSACPLLLDKAGVPPNCEVIRRLLDKHLRPDDWVILANKFQPHEVTESYIRNVVEEWAPRSARTLLLAPRFEFPSFENAFLMQGAARLDNLQPETETWQDFTETVAKLEVPETIRLIDTTSLLCADLAQCSPVKDGQLMYVDGHHFSGEAARQVGASLARKLQAEGW
ncbi:acyltransferase family protein [uncultured Roseobacter sp.]|uniref:acyltransferase family protein n=1 Tax=uncultured Roseobacter sp. TaxID=114847 RepID=UPI002624C31E|nr:acyltransferase family protein [uncultured Roseobacter sp.]